MIVGAHRFFLETISGRRRGVGAVITRAGLRFCEEGFATAAALRGAMYDRGLLNQAAEH